MDRTDLLNNELATNALDIIKKFNRKERYHLVKEALMDGEPKLNPDFHKRLKVATGQEIPENSYVAIDYHLDWIAAALYLTKKYQTKYINSILLEEKIPGKIHEKNGHNIITGNQLDTDLAVIYINNSLLHIIMIEVKVETGWNGKQLSSKGKRLKEIFGCKGNLFSFVNPVFVIAGPKLDYKTPNFLPKTIKYLPGFFFSDKMPGKYQPDASKMYKMELSAKQDLYKPTRYSDNNPESEWRVKLTFKSGK